MLHLATGLMYLLGLFILSTLDVFGGQRRRDAFTAALALVGLTIATHHLHHAFRMHHHGGGDVGDLWTVLFTVPPAATWLYLRGERIVTNRSSAGDRRIPDHPTWISVYRAGLMLSAGAAVGYALARGLNAAEDPGPFWSIAPWYEWAPQFVVAISFAIVGVELFAQARFSASKRNEWSLAALALAGMFSTCAAVHIIHGANVMRGAYESNGQVLTINWATAMTSAIWAYAVLRVHHEAVVERELRGRRRRRR